MDRRKFLRFTATGAVGASLGSAVSCITPLVHKKGSAVDRHEIPTTCEMCVNKCSVIAVVEDGRIRKLNPNPENPKTRNMVCARGNAGLQQVYDPARLKKPLIRAGARGEGKWKPVSWDEAFDFAADKLLKVKERYGAQGTLWSSSESFNEVFFKSLGQAFGSPNIVRHPTLCLASVNLAYSLTFGTVPSFDVLNAKYIIMSGANRLESIITPDSIDLVESTVARKARLIYLDPRVTVTAGKADEWYPIRPGTDLAFILGMLHVIVGEERYDKDFVTKYTVGIEKISEHVKQLTPEWAEAETEIPAKEITRIAREFADAAPRAIYYAGRRSSWYREDFQMRRAQAILNAIVGSWDRQGGMLPAQKIALGEYMFLPWDDPVAPCIDEIDKNYPLASKVDGAYLTVRENVLASQPYAVKAWMVHKQDTMNALPDQARTIRMAEQMDFIGVIDVQMSDTAWYADVVFPESTYLERTDPVEVMGGIVPVVVYRRQVIKPLHDTKHTLEIVQGLAKRLNVMQYFDYTLDQWIAAQVKELPIESPLDYLKKHGAWTPQGAYPKYGTTLNAEHRFVTKSGKIELFSERLQEAGYDPLPVYRAPAQPSSGKFRLLVGRRAYFTHASTTNNAWLNALEPENALWLHPESARNLTVGEGDDVEVASGAGSVRLKARVTREIRPDCVFMLHGFGKRSQWQRLAIKGASDAQVLETAWDKVSGNAALHETFVSVRKA